MGREVLIIGNLGSWIVSGGPKMLDLRWFAVSSVDLHDPFFRAFFWNAIFYCFSILDGFWKVIGGENGCQNRCFGRFFAMLFSSAVWHRVWVHFWRLRTLKYRFSLQRGANSHKIDVFEKSWKNIRFGLHFGRPKPSKIDEKSCLKLSLF